MRFCAHVLHFLAAHQKIIRIAPMIEHEVGMETGAYRLRIGPLGNDDTIFTLPGVPFLYYGDEIGMKYMKDIPSVECGRKTVRIVITAYKPEIPVVLYRVVPFGKALGKRRGVALAVGIEVTALDLVPGHTSEENPDFIKSASSVPKPLSVTADKQLKRTVASTFF